MGKAFTPYKKNFCHSVSSKIPEKVLEKMPLLDDEQSGFPILASVSDIQLPMVMVHQIKH
jgi:hypothetical protein